MTDDYYYGQGRVWLAPYGGDAASWRWIGDVSSLTLKLAFEEKKTQSSVAGRLVTGQRYLTALSGALSATWYAWSAENLALVLQAVRSRRRQSWASETLPAGIVAGSHVALENTNVRDVLIEGLAPGIDFKVNPVFGTLDFLTTPASQPLTVEYDYSSGQTLALLTSKPKELMLRYEGINLADNNRAIFVELYRLSLDPISEAEFLNSDTEFPSLDTDAELLADLTRSPVDEMGQFGRIVIPDDFRLITYNDEIDFDGEHDFAY